MRALFVLADNVYLTPYIRFYLSIFDELGYDYKVLYWDKNQNEKIDNKKYIRYANKAQGPIGKIIGYVKFQKLIKSVCKNNSFDLIVPLHPILLLILYGLLKSEYANGFICDIRDYSYEGFSFFRRIEAVLVKKSVINIISSRGFTNFLPNSEYFIVHNLPKTDCSPYKQLSNRKDGAIQISFIGLIRFMEQNKKIIDFFRNDERFHLNFVGTNAEQLQDYCSQNHITNVTLIGTFNSEDTLAYYDKADLIMNLYGNHMPLLDYALSNKLYYAASVYKPILVCEDTYMEEITEKYNIGFTLKMIDTSEKDKLYNYITNLNRTAYIKQCDMFICNVNQEQIATRKEIIKRLNHLAEI